MDPKQTARFGMSPQDYLSLSRAPRKTRGTSVKVLAYPVPLVAGIKDHMYEEYADGGEAYIYRGGPGRGARLHAQVDPASQSPDYGKGKRVLYETYLPGVGAAEAVASARADADRINRSGRPYGVTGSNSNTVIGDHTAQQFGRRVGDNRTLGYKPVTPWTRETHRQRPEWL